MIVLALLAAIAFAMSVQGGRWWVIDNAEVGPFGGKRCFEDGCSGIGLSWVEAGERWIRVGMGAWAGALISGFMLLVTAAGIAARRVPRLAAKTALVSIATAAITGTWFALGFPSERFPSAEVGRGLPMFLVGIVFGTATAVLVLRRKQ